MTAAPRRVRFNGQEWNAYCWSHRGGEDRLSLRRDGDGSLPDMPYLIVPASMVEDVEPPLPPEPLEGLYRDASDVTWRHHDGTWWRVADGRRSELTWDHARHYGPFVPLVAISPDDPKQIELVERACDQVGDTDARAILRALVVGAS